MTAEEAFYCTILYHANHVEKGNELLHAICKCIVEDAERLKSTNLSYEDAIKSICKGTSFKVEVPATKALEPEKKEAETDKQGLKVLPDELAM